jgi:thymidylate kinase
MKPDGASARSRRNFDQLRLPRFADRDTGRPFVVALEGANGAGKSTVCPLLSRAFAAPVCLGTDDAWLADAVKTRMIRDADWFVSAMFFLSGCCEQMRLLRGRPEPLIIMDRSLWSTLAVHGATSVERLETLLALLQPVASQIPVPDLTLVLETDFATCQSRVARKRGVARQLDDLTATAAFHGREQEFYRWLARQRPEVQGLPIQQAGPEAVADRAAALIRERVEAYRFALPVVS